MKKRPRDPAQLAKMIVDIATGEVEDKKPDSKKDAAAAAMGRKGGAGRVEIKGFGLYSKLCGDHGSIGGKRILAAAASCYHHAHFFCL